MTRRRSRRTRQRRGGFSTPASGSWIFPFWKNRHCVRCERARPGPKVPGRDGGTVAASRSAGGGPVAQRPVRPGMVRYPGGVAARARRGTGRGCRARSARTLVGPTARSGRSAQKASSAAEIRSEVAGGSEGCGVGVRVPPAGRSSDPAPLSLVRFAAQPIHPPGEAVGATTLPQ